MSTPPHPFDAYRGGGKFVFVSYSHRDGAVVYPELLGLHQAGYRIWYDEGIDPGNEWPEEVAKALQAADFFLVFISPAAVQSRNVRNEINYALNHNKPFLAIHIEPTDLPPGLDLRMGDIQAVLKWRTDDARYQRQIVRALPSDLRGPIIPVAQESGSDLREAPQVQTPAGSGSSESLPAPDSTTSETKPTPEATARLTLAAQRRGALQEITVTLHGDIPLVMVKVPKGTFMMGSPDTERGHHSSEAPRHQVTLTHDYYMGKTLVTQAQWESVMRTPARTYGREYGVGASYPVYFVKWDEITGSGGFLEKLNAHLTATGQSGGRQFRLPTEAEWERAARAGTDTRFSFGDALAGDDDDGANAEADPFMWWRGNAGNGTQPVGSKPANGYGLYDMHGNVGEWVQDWFGGYRSAAATDPEGWLSGKYRVFRGGYRINNLRYCRSAARGYQVNPSDECYGFRLCMPA